MSDEDLRLLTKFPALFRLVNDRRFESLIGFLIVFNGVTLGVEADQLPESGSTLFIVLMVMEHIFTLVFLSVLYSALPRLARTRRPVDSQAWRPLLDLLGTPISTDKVDVSSS